MIITKIRGNNWNINDEGTLKFHYMKRPQINPKPEENTQRTNKQRTKGKWYLLKKNNNNTMSIKKKKILSGSTFNNTFTFWTLVCLGDSHNFSFVLWPLNSWRGHKHKSVFFFNRLEKSVYGCQFDFSFLYWHNVKDQFSQNNDTDGFEFSMRIAYFAAYKSLHFRYCEMSSPR